ncbi:hypothetical protein PIB19_01960 [Sphingomonas sp. 7/4-4]|uniref:hypothetical protein n=1 Tax=Sphingomonas sp. 7/4-4 TaxID=3018446 RepID=UPI0022F4064D|nr:hypothetical protein [Sphingomonas sp. 7/4-4]WBY08316.1 hypothetical protein PIB19_01960 [Sphingomonas sp. 7/4-4]
MDESWDIVAEITMYSTDLGGRQGPTPKDKFNCIMQASNHAFDIRINLNDHGSLMPGDRARVPVQFLYPDLAKDYCTVGTKFVLREIGIIGEGVVEQSRL